MLEVGAFEAKNRLGSLLDRVEHGEEIVITRHGKPVARMAPYHPVVDREQGRSAAERIRARGKKVNVAFDWAVLKSDRDLGRP